MDTLKLKAQFYATIYELLQSGANINTAESTKGEELIQVNYCDANSSVIHLNFMEYAFSGQVNILFELEDLLTRTILVEKVAKKHCRNFVVAPIEYHNLFPSGKKIAPDNYVPKFYARELLKAMKCLDDSIKEIKAIEEKY